CSTIQMVAALEPLRQAYGMKKVIVSTYQAVSGAGHEAIDELYSQSQAILNKEDVKPEVMPYQIAFNAIPQIDKFQDNGYTFEEMKMINETKKIMHLPELEVAATCVRLPIETGHSESVYVELESNDATVDDVKSILKDAPGITLQDDPSQQIYPMPADAVGKNDVFVGRIRKDLDRPNGFHMWIVSDNLLKGAAWNSVQIAESLRALKLV
ncbi:aspartate-semialdehyde dehydrogenase, partial [Bacillus altitudinis]|nr:aspartate-semialdehyde dehydrogenase [Bacillus altitudinis]